MNVLDLTDDVKFIISKHLLSDCKMNKTFMTESDDDLQKIIFGEVKEMKIDIDDICIDLKKNTKFDMMKLNFLNKIIIKFIYVSMYACMYVCMYVRIYVCIYNVCMYG